jgi:hypothetical protein
MDESFLVVSVKNFSGYDADYLIEQANDLSKQFNNKARAGFTYYCRYNPADSIYTRERKIRMIHDLEVRFYFSKYNLSYFIMLSEELNLKLSGQTGLIQFDDKFKISINQNGEWISAEQFLQADIMAINSYLEFSDKLNMDLREIAHPAGLNQLFQSR